MGYISRQAIEGDDPGYTFQSKYGKLVPSPLPLGAMRPCRVCGCSGWMRLPDGSAAPPQHKDDCVGSPPAKRT
jgi:hypothetical protein